jgi:hypothetical protein
MFAVDDGNVVVEFILVLEISVYFKFKIYMLFRYYSIQFKQSDETCSTREEI